MPVGKWPRTFSLYPVVYDIKIECRPPACTVQVFSFFKENLTADRPELEVFLFCFVFYNSDHWTLFRHGIRVNCIISASVQWCQIPSCLQQVPLHFSLADNLYPHIGPLWLRNYLPLVWNGVCWGSSLNEDTQTAGVSDRASFWWETAMSSTKEAISWYPWQMPNSPQMAPLVMKEQHLLNFL